MNRKYLDSRNDFERNFHILAEMLRQKRMSFSLEASKSAKSLLKLKTAPNGRINLITIDELARSTANAASRFSNSLL